MIELICRQADHNNRAQTVIVCEVMNPEEAVDLDTKSPFSGSIPMMGTRVTFVSYPVAKVLQGISSIPLEELLTSDVELLREIGKRIQGGQ